MSWSMDRLQSRRRRFTRAIGWRRLSQLASASSRSCGRSSPGSGPPSPRPATWTTARRWCRRPRQRSCSSVGRAGRASASDASSSACAGPPTPEPAGGRRVTRSAGVVGVPRTDSGSARARAESDATRLSRGSRLPRRSDPSPLPSAPRARSPSTTGGGGARSRSRCRPSRPTPGRGRAARRR